MIGECVNTVSSPIPSHLSVQRGKKEEIMVGADTDSHRLLAGSPLEDGEEG